MFVVPGFEPGISLHECAIRLIAAYSVTLKPSGSQFNVSVPLDVIEQSSICSGSQSTLTNSRQLSNLDSWRVGSLYDFGCKRWLGLRAIHIFRRIRLVVCL